MEIKPVESYEQPGYKGFELKSGLKLSAGVAAAAILMGMLSGCDAAERALGGIGFPAQPPTSIEVLAGDVAMPFYTPEPTEMWVGEIAAPDYTPKPTELDDAGQTDPS